MAEYWSTFTMKREGHGEWLLRLQEKAINGFRSHGSVPSEATDGYLVVSVPVLVEQARTLNAVAPVAPGKLPPTGVVAFLT